MSRWRHIKYNDTRLNSSTSFPILLGLTDRVSVVIARRSGAAATAADTLRRRTGSMIDEEAITPWCMLLTCSHTYESRRDPKAMGYLLLCDTEVAGSKLVPRQGARMCWEGLLPGVSSAKELMSKVPWLLSDTTRATEAAGC